MQESLTRRRTGAPSVPVVATLDAKFRAELRDKPRCRQSRVPTPLRVAHVELPLKWTPVSKQNFVIGVETPSDLSVKRPGANAPNERIARSETHPPLQMPFAAFALRVGNTDHP